MQLVATTSFATAKASVGCLILRLLGPKNVWRKRIVWFVIIFTPLVNAINIALTFAQCDPPKALWDRKVKARCWNPNVQLYFAYFMCSENIAADFVLALLPLGMIWKLNLDFKRKAVLCGLLSLGWCAGIAGITKTSYLSELIIHSDLTWVTYDIVVWSGAEDFVIILCGSAPTLKPLWDRYHGNGEPPTPHRYRSRIPLDLEKNSHSLKRLFKKQPLPGLSRFSQQQESDNVDEYKLRTATEFHIGSKRSSKT